jgi:hypothetical protein
MGVDDFPVQLYIQKVVLKLSHYFVYDVYDKYSAEKCD